MSDFLPEGYTVKSTSDNYMKLKTGDNRFRIMTPPILGYEYWVDNENGRKPVRSHMDEVPEISDLPNADPAELKHFWAMVVWNYQMNKVQILEITQKGIQKAITELNRDKDWGSPVGSNGYDIVVNKTGEQKETKYNVIPKPQKPLTADILKAVSEVKIDLNALYSGADPFQSTATVEDKAVMPF